MNETERRHKKIPKSLHRTVTEVLAKLKRHTPHFHFSHASRSISSTTSRLINGCRHPRTRSLSLSLSHNRYPHPKRRHSHQLSTRTSSPVSGESAATGSQQQLQQQVDEAATLEDIDRFLVENFKSLFSKKDVDVDDHDSSEPESEIEETDQRQMDDEEVDDMSTHHQQQPSPGISNVDDAIRSPLIDLTRSRRTFRPPASRTVTTEKVVPTTSLRDVDAASAVAIARLKIAESEIGGVEKEKEKVSDGCIAVLTAASPNPYQDFRESMEKVTEARVRNGEEIDWEFLEELMFSYLRLNEKKQHRFILGAFVDLVVALRQSSDSNGADTSSSGGGGEVEDGSGN